MNIIKVRSPYFIIVNEIGQDGSKIELFIWNKGTTEPATPTYTLSKPIASTTQIDNIYNISNYIREYIDIINPETVYAPTIEENANWAYCKVKRYKLVGVTYTLLDTISYIGVNGFNQYSEGYNYLFPGASNLTLLINVNKIVQHYDSNTPYLNIILNRNTTDDYFVKYYDDSNILIQTETIITSGSSEIFNYKVPLVYDTSVKASIFLGTVNYFSINTKKIEECKYTPVVCTFINRYGGWEFLTFFKQQINTIAVKGTDYKLMPSSVNYNTSLGQSKTFNINGTQTIKLNTGFVDENYSELITDLLLSETVLLDSKPVIVKTQGSDLKTSLKDRLINYEMEFEYAYNLINDVI